MAGEIGDLLRGLVRRRRVGVAHESRVRGGQYLGGHDAPANGAEIADFAAQGVTLFVLATDQSLLKGAVAALLKSVHSS